jgi:enterochelin esterase family protein
MGNPDHRAEEYDALSDDHARMTLDELLPEVAKRWRFAADPKRRAIGGTSSGAIASWTVAWRHPEAFGNVISFIGSYTSIGLKFGADGTPLTFGGDTYPGVIRKARSDRCASSCKMEPPTSTTSMVTGFWPTSRC